jgi:hypothetical protein
VFKSVTQLSPKVLIAGILASFTLAGCGGAPASIADPDLNVYILDLTGSGSTSDQMSRIYDEIQSDVAVENLGKPYGSEKDKVAPKISEVFFVGTNSRYLLDFNLSDYESVKSLYDLNDSENNSSNAVRIWSQLGHTINMLLSDNIEFGSRPITKRECSNKLDSDLSSIFSESKRPGYVDKSCEIILYSSKQYFALKSYIAIQSTKQTHSDVFGAMSAVNDKVSQFLTNYPKGKVKIVMATDGDHNIPFETYPSLKKMLEANPDACSLGRQVGANKSFKALKKPRVDMSDKPGIGALGANSSTTAEYANKLSQFWNCFPA